VSRSFFLSLSNAAVLIPSPFVVGDDAEEFNATVVFGDVGGSVWKITKEAQANGEHAFELNIFGPCLSTPVEVSCGSGPWKRRFTQSLE